MAPTTGSLEERTQKRNNGLYQHFRLKESYPSNSHPNARQFSSSLYVPGAFEASSPELELGASESE